MIPMIVAGIIVMDVLVLVIVAFISIVMRVLLHIFPMNMLLLIMDLKTALIFFVDFFFVSA